MTGKPGIGKTALMSAFIEEHVSRVLSRHCIAHFVGISPISTDIRSTLHRICFELSKRFNIDAPVPSEYSQLKIFFSSLLAEFSKLSSGKFVIFLDAIDQLSANDEARTLEWVPEPIPQGVLFVISTREGDVLDALRSRANITEMVVQPLSLWDRGQVVRSMLSRYRKRLDESPFNNQLKELLSKRDSGIPLYLRIACEELRVGAIFEQVTSTIRGFAPMLPNLLENVISRLVTVHGDFSVRSTLLCYAFARAGLRDSDIHALLLLGYNDNLLHVQSLQGPIVPMDVSGLLLSLEPYLVELNDGSGCRSLFHAEFVSAVTKRYISSSSKKFEPVVHGLLAKHFNALADPDSSECYRNRDEKALNGLVYHLIKADKFQEVSQILRNLKFIQAKCCVGQAYDLIGDYYIEECAFKPFEKDRRRNVFRRELSDYKSFVTRNAHVISVKPSLTIQQALNEPSDNAPCHDASRLVFDGSHLSSTILQWSNKSEELGSCKMTISGFVESLLCVALSPDGFNLAVGGSTGNLRLYSMLSGKEIRTISAHSGAVTDVSFIGNAILATSSYDETLCLWDVATGKLKGKMKQHSRSVNAVVADPAGKFIASAAWDSTVRVFDVRNGLEVACFSGHHKPVNAIAYHPEGQVIISGGWEGIIRVWDSFNKKELAVLPAHLKSIRALAFSPTGRHYVSASLDGAIKLWSAISNLEVGGFYGHALPISKCTFSRNGLELVTVSEDKRVKLFSGNLGAPLVDFGDSKMSWVASVAFSPNGDMLAHAYHNGTVKVTQPDSQPISTLTGHSSSANVVIW